MAVTVDPNARSQGSRPSAEEIIHRIRTAMLEAGYEHEIRLWECEWPSDEDVPDEYLPHKRAGWPLIGLRYNGTPSPGPVWKKATDLAYGVAS